MEARTTKVAVPQRALAPAPAAWPGPAAQRAPSPASSERTLALRAAAKALELPPEVVAWRKEHPGAADPLLGATCPRLRGPNEVLVARRHRGRASHGLGPACAWPLGLAYAPGTVGPAGGSGIVMRLGIPYPWPGEPRGTRPPVQDKRMPGGDPA